MKEHQTGTLVRKLQNEVNTKHKLVIYEMKNLLAHNGPCRYDGKPCLLFGLFGV